MLQNSQIMRKQLYHLMMIVRYKIVRPSYYEKILWKLIIKEEKNQD